eukprot:scaffold1130_cov195-Pinguiococcus_pyrenoidosus.AAC.58
MGTATLLAQRKAEKDSSLVSCTVLVGNKVDLEQQEVSEEDHEAAVSAMGLSTDFRTSARTGENVVAAFETLIRRVHDANKYKSTGPMGSTALQSQDAPRWEGPLGNGVDFFLAGTLCKRGTPSCGEGRPRRKLTAKEKERRRSHATTRPALARRFCGLPCQPSFASGAARPSRRSSDGAGQRSTWWQRASVRFPHLGIHESIDSAASSADLEKDESEGPLEIEKDAPM